MKRRHIEKAARGIVLLARATDRMLEDIIAPLVGEVFGEEEAVDLFEAATEIDEEDEGADEAPGPRPGAFAAGGSAAAGSGSPPA